MEKKRMGRMRVKKEDKAVSESVIAWHYSVLTLLSSSAWVRDVSNTVTLQQPGKLILP
jgi:hypothetical protein